MSSYQDKETADTLSQKKYHSISLFISLKKCNDILESM